MEQKPIAHLPVKGGGGTITSLENNDPQHRTFVMHSLTFDENNVTVVACPSI